MLTSKGQTGQGDGDRWRVSPTTAILKVDEQNVSWSLLAPPPLSRWTGYKALLAGAAAGPMKQLFQLRR